MLKLNYYFSLRYMVPLIHVVLASSEISQKSNKVSFAVSDKSATKPSKLCQLKLHLVQMLEVTPKSNRQGIFDAMEYLTSRMNEINTTCDAFMNHSRRFQNTATVDVSKQNKSELRETRDITTLSIENEGFNVTEDDLTGIDLDRDMLYDDAIDMDEYIDQLGSEDTLGQKLCEDCEMDYDDEKVMNFTRGMSSGEDSSRNGGTNKIVVFFSCVGIGLVLLIVSVTIAAYFGIKKLKVYLNNRNTSSISPTRMNGRNEAYEMN